MNRNTLIYSLLACLVAIQLGACKSSSAGIGKAEAFQSFYETFMKDESFQLSRINFPIPGKDVDGTNAHKDHSTFAWTEANWKKLNDPGNPGSEWKSEWDRGENAATYRLYIPNSGTAIELRFKRLKKKWFLVYYSSVFL